MAKFAFLLRFGFGRERAEYTEFVQVRTLASLFEKYRLLRNSCYSHWSLSVLNIDTSECVIISHDIKHWSLYRFSHKVQSIKNYLTNGQD